jgi:polyisoprenoid-binding protein YceI
MLWKHGLAIVLTAMAAGTVLADSPTPAPQGEVRYVLAPAGNEARYRVREQFVGVNLPSDAVGTTTSITGGIVLDAAGRVIPGTSRFTVDLRSLKSDSENRDRQVQGRILETERFPNIELAIREVRGLPRPLPTTGELKFELVGDLTVKGVTKPSTWQVTATPKGTGLAGRATTRFTFGDFGMPVPTSFRLLSVEDDVRLEYDFHLLRQ